MVRAKRKVSSLSFSLRNVYKKMLTFKPSTKVITIVMIAIMILLLGGIQYMVLNYLPPHLYYGYPYFFFGGLNEQTILGGMFAMIGYAIGVGGILLIYWCAKHYTNPRLTARLFLVGIGIIIISYASVEVALLKKLGLM